MQIDERDEQDINAFCSMDRSLEPDSNVIPERSRRRKKDSLPSVWSEEGMQIRDVTLVAVRGHERRISNWASVSFTA
jgi:hypothetical protein